MQSGSWISIETAIRPEGPVLLRLQDGRCCIGGWSGVDAGWLRSADTDSPGLEQVYPTYFLHIPAFELPVESRARFQVGWRGDAVRTIEAPDAYAAAAAFQQGAPPRVDGEIFVISADGIESVFGYRQSIPTEHLDD